MTLRHLFRGWRPILDPGAERLATPAGTGRLGHPIGTGTTWADMPGQPGIATTDDGTLGGAGAQAAGSTAGVEDGTGTR